MWINNPENINKGDIVRLSDNFGNVSVGPVETAQNFGVPSDPDWYIQSRDGDENGKPVYIKQEYDGITVELWEEELQPDEEEDYEPLYIEFSVKLNGKKVPFDTAQSIIREVKELSRKHKLEFDTEIGKISLMPSSYDYGGVGDAI